MFSKVWEQCRRTNKKSCRDVVFLPSGQLEAQAPCMYQESQATHAGRNSKMNALSLMPSARKCSVRMFLSR